MFTWRQMATYMGHWYYRGFGIWAVEDKSSGRVVGRIGFMDPFGWPALS
jgi:RimJ/RimL family protein N-acetyltransferase